MHTLQAVAAIMTQSKNSFEIYGFDVMLTSDLKPTICEVNACPSLTADTAEDEVVKKRMLHDALNLVTGGIDSQRHGSFHQLYNGFVDSFDDAGAVRTGILLGDETRRVVWM